MTPLGSFCLLLLLRLAAVSTLLLPVALMGATLLQRRFGAPAASFTLRAALAATLALVPLSVLPSYLPTTPRSLVTLPAPPRPLFPAPLPRNAASPTPAPAIERAKESPATETVADTGPRLAAALPIAWLLGMGVGTIWLTIGHFTLHRLRRNSVPCTDAALLSEVRRLAALLGVAVCAVRCHRGDSDTCLAGVVRPVLYLPHTPSWSPEERHAILAHEMAHLARRDLAWNLAAQALRIALWWQPLVWALGRRLEQAAEEACDEAALTCGIAPKRYADLLLRLSENAGGFSRVGGAFVASAAPLRSSVGRRIARLLGRVPASPLSRARRAGIALAALACACGGVFIVGTQQAYPAQQAAAPPQEPEPSALVRALQRPITLVLRDVPVQAALRRLFQVGGLEKYEIPRELTGKITIDLKEVRLYDAINRICAQAKPEVKGMGYGDTYVIKRLPRTGSLTGRVLYPDGAPAPGVYVMAQIQNTDMSGDGDFVSWSDTVTAADGTYRLDRLGDYRYNVMVDLHDYRTSTPPDAITRYPYIAAAAEGVKAVPDKATPVPPLRLVHGGIVEGRVLGGDGKPFPKVRIGSYGPHRPQSSAAIIGTETDAQGYYRLRVAPGESRLYLSEERFHQGERSARDKTVTVAEGETVHLDFQVPEIATP